MGNGEGREQPWSWYSPSQRERMKEVDSLGGDAGGETSLVKVEVARTTRNELYKYGSGG